MLGDDMGMDAPISQDDLAVQAGRYFANASVEQIPEKLWLDCYVAANQWYLRGAWSGRVTTLSLVRLAALAVSLDELYGTELVSVAYASDLTWEEAEDRNRALNEVL